MMVLCISDTVTCARGMGRPEETQSSLRVQRRLEWMATEGKIIGYKVEEPLVGRSGDVPVRHFCIFPRPRKRRV